MKKSKIIFGGRERFEQTDEYRNKVAEIKKEVANEYSRKLLNEKNRLGQLLIVIQRHLEISRRIAELSSDKNLYLIKFS